VSEKLRIIREAEENGNSQAVNLMLLKAASETGEKSKIYCYKAVEAKELFVEKRQSFQK
jgi:hypothetical protein